MNRNRLCRLKQRIIAEKGIACAVYFRKVTLAGKDIA